MEYSGTNPFDPYCNNGEDPFKLIAVGDTGAIKLSWNRMSLTGVEKYLIYRSTDSTAEMEVIKEISDAKAGSYTDKNVTPGILYHYRMSIIASGRESGRSFMVNNKPVASSSPELNIKSGDKEADTLDFGINHSSLQLLVANVGTASLKIDDIQSSEKWITWSEPDTMVIAPGQETIITVRILRDSLTARDAAYFGALAVTSNGGSRNLVIKVVEKENVALLSVVTDTLRFDSTKAMLQLKISNEGNTAMKTCSLSTAQQWVGITPAAIADLAAGQEYQFEITVFRTHKSINVGANTGLVTIRSDGGNGFVTVTAIKLASTTPVISVNDDTLDFGDKRNSMLQLISNIGTGTLSWQVTTPAEKWLSIAKPQSGTLKADSSISLELIVNRDSITEPGSYSQVINVTSNGGNRSFVALVNKKEDAAVLSVVADTLRFDSTKAMLQLKIRNEGNVVMKTCSLSTAQQWIGIAPAAIADLAAGQEYQFEITVSRTHNSINVGANTGLVTIRSDGGNGFVTVTAIKLASITPVLSVNEDTLDFGDNRNSMLQLISNTGTGTLNWQVTTPAEKWLKIANPQSGTLKADSSISLELIVNRDSIAEPGRYSQIINVTSNGGNRSFVVLVNKKEVEPPAAPVLKVASVKPDAVTLSWTTNTEEQFTEYTLYRGASENVDDRDQKLFTSSNRADTVFTDTTVESLKSYCYRVYTTGSENKKTAGNVVSASTPALRVLKGTVKDKTGNSGIEGVSVKISGTSDSVLSGTGGTFRFENPSPGNAHLQFAKNGYLISADTVTIPQKDSVTLNISLLQLPLRKRVGAQSNFIEPGDIAIDKNYIYVLERDWQLPRVVVVSAGSADGEIASVNLAGHCETPGRIAVSGTSVYVSCPVEKKILRIANVITVASVTALDLDFSPYGIHIDGSNLMVAGQGGGSDGVVAAIDVDGFDVSWQYTIPLFNATIGTASEYGPLVTVSDGVSYVSNGSLTVGMVAKVNQSGGSHTSVDMSWPRISGLSIYGDDILVSSSHTSCDSVLFLNSQLQPIKGIHSTMPVSGVLYAGETGKFGGLVLGTGSGDSSKRKNLVFMQKMLGRAAGVIGFENDLISCAISPDGAKIAVITGQNIELVY